MDLYYNNYQIEDLPNEIWIDVLGYDGLYSVSNLGRVKSEQRELLICGGNTRIKKARIMRQNIRAPHKHHQKHASVMFAVDNIHKRFEVSYIAGMSFIRPLNKDEIYIHKDKNALNNRIENIEIMKKANAVRCGQTANKKSKGNISNIKKRKIAEYIRLSDGKIFDCNSIKKEYPALKDPTSNVRRSIVLKRKRMGSFWIINSFVKTIK